MPQITTAQRRAHYDYFVADVIELCATSGVRTALRSGRGQPVENCARMQKYLTTRIGPYGARRAHYTVASFIAMQRHLADDDAPYTAETALDDTTPNSPGVGSGQDALPYEPPTTAVALTAGTDKPAAGPQQTSRHWRARPNLGATLAIAVARHGFKQSSMDNRIQTLTKLSTPLLHPRLWTLTAHLNNRHAARLDFAVLLEDLAWWDYDRLHIADRWRESYFLTLDLLHATQDN